MNLINISPLQMTVLLFISKDDDRTKSRYAARGFVENFLGFIGPFEETIDGLVEQEYVDRRMNNAGATFYTITDSGLELVSKIKDLGQIKQILEEMGGNTKYLDRFFAMFGFKPEQE